MHGMAPTLLVSTLSFLTKWLPKIFYSDISGVFKGKTTSACGEKYCDV